MRVRTGVWFFPDARAGTIVETILAAEALGLDEVWLGDEGPARDPFVLLAAAAAVTERIALGVAVTNPYLRHPAATAAAALTIHELSGGRMRLGIGPGGDLALKPAHIPRTAPLAAVERAVRIVRAVARGQSTDGYTPVPHALSAPDLPIFIGARGERLNRLASRVADGVFLGGIPRSRLAPTTAWARGSRDNFEVAAYLNAVFDERAREALRPRLLYALLDAPEVTRAALGVCRRDAEHAAEAMSHGDDQPARTLVDDARLAELVIHASTPTEVGVELAARVRPIQPTSIGITLLGADPLRYLEPAAEALTVAARALEAT